MDLKDIVSRQVYSTHHHLHTQQLTPISNRPSSSSSSSSSSSITPLPKISCITEPPTPISPLIVENANDTRRPRSLPSPETSPESHQNAFKKTSVTESTAIPPVASSSSALIAHGSISPEQLPSSGPSSSTTASNNKRSLDDSSDERSPKRLQSSSSDNKPSIALMAPTTVSSTSTTSRRHAHILSEQRRRENINGGFQLLKNTVPFCRGTQDSKAMILKKAVEYIMTLEHELSAYRGQQPQQQQSSNEHHYHIPSATQGQTLPQQSVDYSSYSYQQLPPPPPPPSAPPMQYQRQSIPPPLPNSYASSRAYYMNPISRPTSTPPLTNTYSMYSQRRKSDGSTNQLAPTTGSPNESPSSHQPTAHHQLAHHQMSYPPPPPRTYSPPSFMHGGMLPKP